MQSDILSREKATFFSRHKKFLSENLGRFLPKKRHHERLTKIVCVEFEGRMTLTSSRKRKHGHAV